MSLELRHQVATDIGEPRILTSHLLSFQSFTKVSCSIFKSATLAVDPDDDDIGRIIIIGGWLGTGPLAASDMHVLDISHSGKQLRWYEPPVRGTPPGPCNMHSSDYVAATHEVYVFRGGKHSIIHCPLF